MQTNTVKQASDHPSRWVDSSYAIHPYKWSHSGIFMTLGTQHCQNRNWTQKVQQNCN